VTAIFDTDKDRARHFAESSSLPASIICRSIEELFRRCDAVSICTPNFTHADLITQSAQAGKHLLCEKPLSVNWEDARRAAATAESRPGLIAMIAFNYRDIPAIRYIKRVLDGGKMGHIFAVHQQLGGNRIADPVSVGLEWRMRRERSGPGALADFGSHLLDLTDFLFAPIEGPITEVQAEAETFIRKRKQPENDKMGEVTNDDIASFTARLESGSLLTYLVSRIGMPWQMLEIIAEGGMVIYTGNPTELELRLKDPRGSYDPARRKRITVPPELSDLAGHKGVVHEFLGAIESGTKPSRSLDYGLRIQKLIDWVEQARETREWVTLSYGLE
jgi:predicted dehydrogenase